MTPHEMAKRLAKLEDDKLAGHVIWTLCFAAFIGIDVANREPAWEIAVMLVVFAFHVMSVRPQWRRYKAAKALAGMPDD